MLRSLFSCNTSLVLAEDTYISTIMYKGEYIPKQLVFIYIIVLIYVYRMLSSSVDDDRLANQIRAKSSRLSIQLTSIPIQC